jgi:hypothetical protein
LFALSRPAILFHVDPEVIAAGHRTWSIAEVIAPVLSPWYTLRPPPQKFLQIFLPTRFRLCFTRLANKTPSLMPSFTQTVLCAAANRRRITSNHIAWYNGRCVTGEEIAILADGRVAPECESGSCESCDDRILSDDLVSVTTPRRFGGGSRRPTAMWCGSCVRSNWFECSDCRETFHQDLSCGNNTAEECVCEGCAESYFSCESCNSTCRNDNYGEDGNCQDCSDCSSSAIIKPYSFKDYALPIGKGPLFFGIELEVEAGDNRDSASQDIAAKMEDFAVLKEDGSIRSGFEIVTRPASLVEQRRGWKGFFSGIPAGLLSYKTETCGLHVHCSRSALTTLQIAKTVCFVNSPDNRDFVERIAGRKACDWAKYHGKKLATAGKQTGQRYEAVNLENAKTIEFRIFKGTLKESSFWRCIEFCDALISFAAPASRTMAESLDWKAFARFVREGRKQWPNLHAFVDQRILGNVPNQRAIIKVS